MKICHFVRHKKESMIGIKSRNWETWNASKKESLLKNFPAGGQQYVVHPKALSPKSLTVRDRTYAKKPKLMC